MFVVVVADRDSTASSETVDFAENITRSCTNIPLTSGDQDTQIFNLTIVEPRFNLSTNDLPAFRMGCKNYAVVKVDPEPDVKDASTTEGGGQEDGGGPEVEGNGEGLNAVCLDIDMMYEEFN